jgi:hypothetical protein
LAEEIGKNGSEDERNPIVPLRGVKYDSGMLELQCKCLRRQARAALTRFKKLEADGATANRALT